jgi:GNAT superfamily N-acetyltransferase
MKNIVYRKANKNDVQEIAELTSSIISKDIETKVPHQCVFSKQKVTIDQEKVHIEECIEDPGYTIIIASVENKIAGVLYLFEETYPDDLVPAPHSTIEIVFTHIDFRKQGIGKGLIAEAEKVAKQMNHTFIDLQVWENNQHAFDLYEKTGFQTIEKRMVKKIK